MRTYQRKGPTIEGDETTVDSDRGASKRSYHNRNPNHNQTITKLRNVEEQLRKSEDRVVNFRMNLRDAEQRLTQKEAQEENLRSTLK